MVVIDATVLLLLLDSSAKAPLDPNSKTTVEACQKRIEFLVKTLSESKTRVLVPTPALSEVLVVTRHKGPADYLDAMTRQYAFVIQPFDVRAAVEVALLTDSDLQSKRQLSPGDTKAKVKYDRQIIAIAKVNGCATIYSDDSGLAAVAKQNGIHVITTAELPLSPQDQQQELSFPSADLEIPAEKKD